MLEKLKKHLVFTTHTPEEAGNEKHDIYLCQKMSYFCGLSVDEVRKLTGIEDNQFNHSLVALRFAKLLTAFRSCMEKLRDEMWSKYAGICPITSITNAQNWRYWADKQLYASMDENNDWRFDDRKWYLKKRAFEIVADQTGKIFNPKYINHCLGKTFCRI